MYRTRYITKWLTDLTNSIQVMYKQLARTYIGRKQTEFIGKTMCSAAIADRLADCPSWIADQLSCVTTVIPAIRSSITYAFHMNHCRFSKTIFYYPLH